MHLRWSGKELAVLLDGVLAQQCFWDRKDADLQLAVASIISDSLARCAFSQYTCDASFWQ